MKKSDDRQFSGPKAYHAPQVLDYGSILQITATIGSHGAMDSMTGSVKTQT